MEKHLKQQLFKLDYKPIKKRIMKKRFLLLSTVALFSSATLFAQDIKNGLVVYYNMEEGVNGDAPDNMANAPIDLSGNNNNSVNRGQAPKGHNFKTEPDFNSFSFGTVLTSEPDVPGHISTPAGVLNRGKGDYSIAFWVRVEDSNLPVLQGHKDYQFLAYNQKVNAQNMQGTNIAGLATPTLACMKDGKFAAVSTNEADYFTAEDMVEYGRWYHYAVTSSLDFATTILYIDGKEVARKEIPLEEQGDLIPSDGGVILRRGGGGNLEYENPDNPATPIRIPTQRFIFEGAMDEFRIYDRVLTPEEVVAIMNVNKNGSVDIENNIDNSGISVYVSEKNIIVENSEGYNMAIYNCTGSLISNQKIDSNHQVVSMNQSGIYLVRINNETFRIILK